MAWAARWRAALTRARTSATRALEISGAAFSLGSGSLGGSGRLTSLAFGCAHNNAILSWHEPISVTLRHEPTPEIRTRLRESLPPYSSNWPAARSRRTKTPRFYRDDRNMYRTLSFRLPT